MTTGGAGQFKLLVHCEIDQSENETRKSERVSVRARMYRRTLVHRKNTAIPYIHTACKKVNGNRRAVYIENREEVIHPCVA